MNEDLKQFESDNEIISVNGFFVKGYLLLDDIGLSRDITIPKKLP